MENFNLSLLLSKDIKINGYSIEQITAGHFFTYGDFIDKFL